MAAAALVAAVLFNMRATPLERLGEIATPPAYQPVAVRAARDSVATMTDSGMVAYASGDYAAAERLLARVAEVQHTSGGMFFLGVSRLMLGRTDGALDALRGAVEPSGNPYSLEARFYLAKAWLRAGNADSALAQLLLIPVGSKLDIGARALEDSTRAALLR